ncbi:hypothetical protein HELRODRAFT_164825 [Helobdella robusta]|uniref:Uncharacterized protein n=1 Tax=Helobdella robusta TaxID=6412 RepID=T1EVU9_HELRO|nr:hypothetical protein HELRODRAFT_164825 [Helobdella robusta]ESN92728.1 hypothetical protein HELRODRAFT_164825 [Helobdella robusta]
MDFRQNELKKMHMKKNALDSPPGMSVECFKIEDVTSDWPYEVLSDTKLTLKSCLTRNLFFYFQATNPDNPNDLPKPHCSNGSELTEKGTCESEQCDIGWKGLAYNTKDCKAGNGDCNDMVCIQSKIGARLIAECLCKPGYVKNKQSFCVGNKNWFYF